MTSEHLNRRDRMRGMNRTFALVSAVLLLWCGILSVPAAAQVAPPPVRPSVDENGVDLVDHSFTTSATDLSIGPNDGTGLAYTRYISGSTYTNNVTGAITGSTTSPVVSVGGSSEGFSGPGGSSFTSDEPSGSTLSLSGSTYTYTTSDGTVYQFFSNPSVTGVYFSMLGYLTSITSPNGQVTTFDYDNPLLEYCISYGTLPNGQFGCWVYGWQGYLRLRSVRNNNGYQLKLTYASNDINLTALWQQLATVTAINNANDYCDPLAATCSFTQSWNSMSISTSGSTTTYSDALGNGVAYTNSGTQLVGIERNGHTTNDVAIGYNTDGSVHTITKAGQTWTYAYSSDGSDPNIVTVTDPASNTRVYRFSSNDRMHSYADENTPKRVTTYAYNDPTGVASLNTITLPGSDVFTYAYDSRNNVTSITRTAKTGFSGTISTSATYPSTCTYVASCNKPATTTDERGKVTSYTYNNTTGAVTQVVAPADSSGNHPTTNYGYTSLYAWTKNSSGTLVAAATPISLLTSTSTCQTNPSCTIGSSDETRATIAYEAGSSSVKSNLLPVSVSKGSGTSPSMSVTASGYDIYGNVTSVDGPLSGTADTTRTYYNISRQVTGQVGSDPDGSGDLVPTATHTSYRSDGRVDHVDVGTVSSPTSDPSTLTVAETATQGFDSYARPIRQTLSAGGTTYAITDTSYDTLGRPLCTAQRLNLSLPPGDACTAGTAGSDGPDRINYTNYNADGSVHYVQSGYGVSPQTVATYTYTSNGKLATLTDANGNVTTQDYDGFDRVVKVQLPSPTARGSSSTTDYQELVLDNVGNVTSRHLRGYYSDSTKHIDYSYDDLGRLTLKHVGDGTVSDVYYGYDLLGRMLYARFGSTNGAGITNAYDALGELTSTSNNMSGTSYALSYQYDAAGNRTRITHPDGNYFAYNRYVTGENFYTTLNGSTQLTLFNLDSWHRRWQRYRGVAGSWQYPSTLSYDGASRVSGLSHTFASSGDDVTYGYGYNAASQITSKTSSNGAYAFTGYADVNRNYTTNGLNQYTAAGSASFSYDARGNLTGDGSNSYGYDAENRMTGVSGSYSATLTYDPYGRLYSVASGGSTTRMLYDGGDLVAEYDGSGNLLRRYVHGDGDDQPEVWYEGSGVSSPRFLYTDERGSVVAVTDSSANLTNVDSYDEYGIPASGNVGRFQYTGQAWLAELGIYYYKARMYSPTLGRFMQTDPIGYGDGPNWYNYAHGDPVNWVDPTGTRMVYSCVDYLDGTMNCGWHDDGSGDPPTAPATVVSVQNTILPQTPDIGGGDELVVTGRRPQNKPSFICNIAGTIFGGGKGTAQLGIAGTAALGPGAATVGGGVAIDRYGNVGLYGFFGGGRGAGEYVGGGGSAQISNADGIQNLSGAFANVSGSGGAGWAGTLDGFTGPSAGGPVTGGGVTLGGGEGAGFLAA